jgi:subtilisin family serine protease
MNMSLSAYATTPYFVDPLNRAVEAAWANGIVVVAAAGNEGRCAETLPYPATTPT